MQISSHKNTDFLSPRPQSLPVGRPLTAAFPGKQVAIFGITANYGQMGLLLLDINFMIGLLFGEGAAAVAVDRQYFCQFDKLFQ